MTIGENLQIVRGEGCGFRPGESPNDLESAQHRVSAWIEQNGADSDEPPSNWTSPDAPCAKFDDLRKPLLSDISVKIDAGRAVGGRIPASATFLEYGRGRKLA